jgi:hypothetical protein
MCTKICKQRGKEGPLELFQRDISKKDKARPECKECTAANRKKRYNPSRNRMHNMQKNFGKGILETYQEIFEAQGGVCAICASPENGRYVHLSVDHNHDTGKIRGLLCNNCNRGIGLLKDDPKILEQAKKYLENSC